MITKRSKKSKEAVEESPEVAANCKVPVEVEETTAAEGEGAEAVAQPQAAAAAPDVTEEAVDEVALFKDRYARLMADFDNFRKRQVRERAEVIKRANESLLSDLLPVLDHLELALAQAADPQEPFVAGVRMVYDQFVTLLDGHGMTPLDTLGEPFDPNFHEALSQSASDEVPANTIVQQFRRGWLLNGHLVRAAQVIVSSGPAEQATEPQSNPNGAE